MDSNGNNHQKEGGAFLKLNNKNFYSFIHFLREVKGGA